MANYYGDDTGNFQVDGFENYYGGNGNDVLKGAAGANELYGGEGNDLLAGGDAIQVIAPEEVLGNGSAENPYRFTEDQGPSGNDTLEGGSGNDGIYGFDGDDYIDGGQGDDGGLIVAGGGGGAFYIGGLFGGDGDDEIHGGAGDDEITGGDGQDDMLGGAGEDTFFFGSIEEIGKGSTSDFIGDFRGKDGDLIDLSAIDAKPNKDGDQEFKWIGDDKFSKPGQLSFKNGKVKINTDNDKAPEAVLLVNANKMDADDFIL